MTRNKTARTLSQAEESSRRDGDRFTKSDNSTLPSLSRRRSSNSRNSLLSTNFRSLRRCALTTRIPKRPRQISFIPHSVATNLYGARARNSTPVKKLIRGGRSSARMAPISKSRRIASPHYRRSRLQRLWSRRKVSRRLIWMRRKLPRSTTILTSASSWYRRTMSEIALKRRSIRHRKRVLCEAFRMLHIPRLRRRHPRRISLHRLSLHRVRRLYNRSIHHRKARSLSHPYRRRALCNRH